MSNHFALMWTVRPTSDADTEKILGANARELFGLT
jgi:predicted TIM-barrel fold metal-dependent hydrolase